MLTVTVYFEAMRVIRKQSQAISTSTETPACSRR